MISLQLPPFDFWPFVGVKRPWKIGLGMRSEKVFYWTEVWKGFQHKYKKQMKINLIHLVFLKNSLSSPGFCFQTFGSLWPTISNIHRNWTIIFHLGGDEAQAASSKAPIHSSLIRLNRFHLDDYGHGLVLSII